MERAGRDAPPDSRATLCNALKEHCPALSLEAAQREALEDVRKILAGRGDDVLFAVRSSSPEEDLVSASFADGYETRLGVRGHELEQALLHCFASTFDERVFVYKREHGFDVLSPRLAVVVQQQIASEVAEVGFSLNPLTNDYDEAVIDANWGLGESVAAGLASPDHFVVDKVSGKLIQKKLGAKQVSIWLGRDRGTVERQGYRSTDLTLSKAQLGELVDVLCRIEELYGRPTDIEWAYADSQLHVLQARPITTHVPLPPEMATNPGERRRLYVDAALSKGLTTNEPISPLGLSWIEGMLYSSMMKRFAGIEDFTPDRGSGVLGGQPILHEPVQCDVARDESQGDVEERRRHRRADGQDPGQHRSEAIPRGDPASVVATRALVLHSQSFVGAARALLECALEPPHPEARVARVPTESRRL